MGTPKHQTHEIDLSSLVLGFSSAALSYLSEPFSEKKLELAKQNIDIIRMLEQRTASTHSGSETQLFKEIIRDLQLKYAEAHGKLGKKVTAL